MNEMTRLVAAPDSFKARFTTAEFLRMCEADAFEDWKIELVDGELERLPLPMNQHSKRQGQVLVALFGAVAMERVRATLGLELSGDTVLACDAAVLHAPVLENRWLRGEELALVVEVADASRARDLGMKRRNYASALVPVYWVVDESLSVTHVHRAPKDRDYTDIHAVPFGEPLAVPGTDQTITLS